MTDVKAYADQLRQHAEHFQQRDWDYTRDTGDLAAIRYNRPEDSLLGRLKGAAGWLFRGQPEFAKGWGPNRFSMALYALRRDRHLPDGTLSGGSIITFWEEDGEYLQYVQPSVGSIIADWMDAEPDNPHAIRVADEMKRINDRYGDRLKETA